MWNTNKTGSTIQYCCFVGLQIKQCILKGKQKCQEIDNLVISIQKSRNYWFLLLWWWFLKLHLGLQSNSEQTMLKNTAMQTTPNPAHGGNEMSLRSNLFTCNVLFFCWIVNNSYSISNKKQLHHFFKSFLQFQHLPWFR